MISLAITQANTNQQQEKTVKGKWMGEFETIEASFRQRNISYEQLENKLAKASKDNWMGEYESSMETSFQ